VDVDAQSLDACVPLDVGEGAVLALRDGDSDRHLAAEL
jgi:hypothetical protein